MLVYLKAKYYKFFFISPRSTIHYIITIYAGAVSVTWFALGVQAPNYIFVIREQYQTKPDICTSLILKKKFCHVIPWGNDPYVLLFCL